MHQPRKWWIGLPVLGGLVFFATQASIPRIEADLRARASLALGRDPADVVVTGRDVVISGLSPAARDAARRALRYTPGLRKFAFVDAGVSAPATPAELPPSAPPRDPYVFSASLHENMLALTGQLPDEILRKHVAEAAAVAAAGAGVSDNLKVADGAPAGDYAAAVNVALDALKSLSPGRVVLTDGGLAIEGKGRANVRASQLAAEIKAKLPNGFDLASVEVAPGAVSPYVFDAARKDGVVTLSGFAPDAARRARLVDGARRRFFDASVEDRLEIADGAPEKFADVAEAALAALSRLDEGRLSISDDQLTIEGAARHAGARAVIEAALAERLPTGVKFEPRLTTVAAPSQLDAAGCRAALAELSKTPVGFDGADAIAEDSVGLVDALTATILRCGGVAIEVAGHVDDQGVAELDRDRAKRRAQRLVDVFVKAGADSFYVWAMGYGAERPLAPNDSDANRARNRRVEFNVKPPRKEGAQ